MDTPKAYCINMHIEQWLKEESIFFCKKWRQISNGLF